MLDKLAINQIRNHLCLELTKYDANKHILLDGIDEDVLLEILFDKCDLEDGNYFYSMAFINDNDCLSKLNFSNIPFDKVWVRGMNFKNLYGAKINPQTVYNRDLSNANLENVEFIGPFTGANIASSIFKNNINAKIKVQDINNKCLDGATFDKTTCLIGPFDGVSYKNAKGSNSLIVIPDTYQNKAKIKTKISSIINDYKKNLR